MVEFLFSPANVSQAVADRAYGLATELIDKLCVMEEAEAGWATASGMAAVFTSLAALLKSGDHVVACRSVFGSTHQLFTKILPKWGISHTYVDCGKLSTSWIRFPNMVKTMTRNLLTKNTIITTHIVNQFNHLV